MKTGLVLEGGGMRGTYTAGALDVLLEKELYVDYVMGISAGACSGSNFVSRQKERLWTTTVKYVEDKRYAGVGSFIKTGSFIGMDYVFNKLPNEIDPFDFDAFINSETEFVTAVTNAETAQAEYISKAMMPHGNYDYLAAACSLPVFSPAVKIGENYYYDGGVVDPIPVDRALQDGCDRIIVVLTQPEGYQKGPQKGGVVYKAVVRKFPKIVEMLKTRHEIYNRELERVRQLEKEGVALVLRPSRDTGVSRLCRDTKILNETFQLGREDMLAVADRLPEFTRGGVR